MGAFRILTYHRVGEPRDDRAAPETVAPRAFRQQMGLLRALRWVPLDVEAAPHFIADGRVPSGYYALTFDDGFADLFDHALPLLQEFGMPAVVYVVANRSRADWTDWGPLGPHRLLSWPQIEQMADAGIAIGSHTSSHVDLTTCNARRLDEEVRGSKRRIEDRLGRPIRHFCYPYGRTSEKVIDTVRCAGYATACTTQRGPVRETSAPFALPRLAIDGTMGLMPFAARVLGG